jgi:hypothetical protein
MGSYIYRTKHYLPTCDPKGVEQSENKKYATATNQAGQQRFR